VLSVCAYSEVQVRDAGAAEATLNRSVIVTSLLTRGRRRSSPSRPAARIDDAALNQVIDARGDVDPCCEVPVDDVAGEGVTIAGAAR